MQGIWMIWEEWEPVLEVDGLCWARGPALRPGCAEISCGRWLNPPMGGDSVIRSEEKGDGGMEGRRDGGREDHLVGSNIRGWG